MNWSTLNSRPSSFDARPPRHSLQCAPTVCIDHNYYIDQRPYYPDGLSTVEARSAVRVQQAVCTRARAHASICRVSGQGPYVAITKCTRVENRLGATNPFICLRHRRDNYFLLLSVFLLFCWNTQIIDMQ